MVAEAFSEQPVLADARLLHAAYSSLVSLEEMAKDASSMKATQCGNSSARR